ncbi:MAG TPA: FmdB family zinc ribbon protein [Thermoanaerobaculia bacterium]
MPIYEYVCESCRKKTEAIQRVGEKPLKICPHCGGKLKKAFSAPAIQFKGSGWYVTDYAGSKGEQKRKEAAADTKEASGEAKGSEAKGSSDEKPEKKEKPEKRESDKKSSRSQVPSSKKPS